MFNGIFFSFLKMMNFAFSIYVLPAIAPVLEDWFIFHERRVILHQIKHWQSIRINYKYCTQEIWGTMEIIQKYFAAILPNSCGWFECELWLDVIII